MIAQALILTCNIRIAQALLELHIVLIYTWCGKNTPPQRWN